RRPHVVCRPTIRLSDHQPLQLVLDHARRPVLAVHRRCSRSARNRRDHPRTGTTDVYRRGGPAARAGRGGGRRRQRNGRRHRVRRHGAERAVTRHLQGAAVVTIATGEWLLARSATAVLFASPTADLLLAAFDAAGPADVIEAV